MLLVGVGLIAIGGIFSFELSRFLLARSQLKAVTEVAALTCETALISSGNTLDSTNQQNSINTAVALLRLNSILGQSLSSAMLVDGPGGLCPDPGNVAITFQYLDPVLLEASQGLQGTGRQGTVIEADSAYCYQPVFGAFIGLGQTTFKVVESAKAGLPRKDVVIALDCSMASEGQTLVTFVHRQCPNGQIGPFTYSIPNVHGDPTTPAIGPYAVISGQLCLPPNGPNRNGPNMTFAVANLGTPHDHFHSYISPNNFDYNDGSQGASGALEVILGHLESWDAAIAAGIDPTGLNMNPQAGYQADYYSDVTSDLQPWDSIMDGVQCYLDQTVRTADCHFSAVVFCDQVGTDQNSSVPQPNTNFLYPVGQPAPIPFVVLNQGAGPSSNNYAFISSILPTLQVVGKRDVALALHMALNEFVSGSTFCRPQVNQEILLVVTGTPDYDMGQTTTDHTHLSGNPNLLAQAQLAASMGVTVNVVAIAQSGSDHSSENSMYGESVTGLAGVVGNGSSCRIIDWTDASTFDDASQKTFSNVARGQTRLRTRTTQSVAIAGP